MLIMGTKDSGPSRGGGTNGKAHLPVQMKFSSLQGSPKARVSTDERRAECAAGGYSSQGNPFPHP